MFYKREEADIKAKYPTALRKSTIIVLLVFLLVALTFVRTGVNKAKGIKTQEAIDVKDVPVTKQKIEQPKQSKAKKQVAEVVEAEDEDVADTVTIAKTDLKADSEYVPPPMDEPKTVSFHKLEDPPKMKVNVQPEYPDMARKSGMEGVVLVEVVVDTTGNVEEAEVVKARPEGVFEEAALKAAKQWKFEPARQQGNAVKVRVQKPLRFKLEK